ncbi:MAG: amidohydrolase family protein [Sphaerochaeta sp.]|jgi:predicted TIM-barrel fold metal-dependent hydrolase|nr:amidohydrolase family protein [Sphaerochaeta sp.]
MEYFFDQHFHLMDISHPNLISFFGSLESGITELFTSGALLPSYILTPKNRRSHTLLSRITNTLTTFEQPIGQTLLMMEDDLSGAYASHDDEAPTPEQPYIRDGALHFRSRTYDKMALCPMLMDFSSSPSSDQSLYYPSVKKEKILTYIDDTLTGFSHYRTNHPNGLFDFFPFVGINPPVHSLAFIKELLATFVVTERAKSRGKRRFYGIKVYPPLGYDPWPADKGEREKVIAIYEFCTENKIPIMTHCDDQGFRGLTAKEAWRVSEPDAWRPVLAQFPLLTIDFAHFGWQYTPRQKNPLTVLSGLANKVPDSSWFYQIITLMKSYPNIYADVSFSGANAGFYDELYNYLSSLEGEERETIVRRILFGTDFSVNLMKVESYTSYYRLFETAPFSDDEIHSFVQTNPMRYMGMK